MNRPKEDFPVWSITPTHFGSGCLVDAVLKKAGIQSTSPKTCMETEKLIWRLSWLPPKWLWRDALKLSKVADSTTWAGSLFHSLMDAGKNEYLYASILVAGLIYFWLWGLLDLALCTRCWLIGISTSSWQILYIKDNLWINLLVSNVSHFKSERSFVTVPGFLE